MPQTWRAIWRALWPRLSLIGGLALLIWALFDARWAALAFAGACLLIVVTHYRTLLALANWLKEPGAAPYPNANGLLGDVFANLASHLRATAQAGQHTVDELALFREAIEALPNGIVLLNPHQRILWCNHAAASHLGISLARDRGAILGQLVRAPGFATFLERQEASTPFLMQSPGAPARTYSVAVVSFGTRQHILISTDITDAKRVESMRSDFIANVSHELRTPLTVVNGFLEHFHEGTLMDEDQRIRIAQLMSDQTKRMLSLVDDLLTLSRLEFEDVPANEEILDMDELMAGLAALARGLSAGRHPLTFNCAAPALRGNRQELHSAFANLISNAIRYTPEGEKIEVTWSMEADQGVFAVQDSGVGIAAEHLPRLTERFYRVDRGRSRDSGGTGLGLAIVKHVLLRHQATLDIRSQPGEGSRFAAVFPAWRLSASPTSSTRQ